ncbi:MAG TPA: hypothetical protein VIB00_00665, partial [Pyrinomonadaceae bacterium]
ENPSCCFVNLKNGRRAGELDEKKCTYQAEQAKEGEKPSAAHGSLLKTFCFLVRQSSSLGRNSQVSPLG